MPKRLSMGGRPVDHGLDQRQTSVSGRSLAITVPNLKLRNQLGYEKVAVCLPKNQLGVSEECRRWRRKGWRQ